MGIYHNFPMLTNDNDITTKLFSEQKSGDFFEKIAKFCTTLLYISL